LQPIAFTTRFEAVRRASRCLLSPASLTAYRINIGQFLVWLDDATVVKRSVQVARTSSITWRTWTTPV